MGQNWQTGERLGSQEWQTGERLGSQDWQSGENRLDRRHEIAMQDDMQEFQFQIQNNEHVFSGEQNRLNRELDKYKADLNDAVAHRNLDVVSDRNRQIARVEAEQARLSRKQFMLDALKSFSAAPEMLFFMSQSTDPAEVFGELFSDSEGTGGTGANLEAAFGRLLADVQDPRFATNLQQVAQLGGEEQARAAYAHTARTGDRNPGATWQGQAPLSMPSQNVTRQTVGRVV